MEGYAVDPALAAQMGFSGFGNTNKRRKYDKAVVDTAPSWAPAPSPTTAYSPNHAIPQPPLPHPLAGHPMPESAVHAPSPQRQGHWQPPPHQHQQGHGYWSDQSTPPVAHYQGQPSPTSTYYQQPSPTTSTHYHREHHVAQISQYPSQQPQTQLPYPPPRQQVTSQSPIEAPNPHNLPKPPSWPPTGDLSNSFRPPGLPTAFTPNLPRSHNHVRKVSIPKPPRPYSHPQHTQMPAETVSWESFPAGAHECDATELAALRKGVRDRDGDVAYFMPSFVEDPWNRKAKVKVEIKEIEADVKDQQPKEDEVVAFAVTSAVEDPWNRTE